METYTVLETVHQRISTIEFWSNGITYIKMDDNAEMMLEDSLAQYHELKARFDGKNKFKLLVEPGRYTGISAEAREFSSQKENNAMTTASAVIIKSLAHRLVINFVINFTQKQTMKMQMFDSKEKAIEWLLSFKTGF